MINKLESLLKLIRPANILTAFADILAGFAAAGGAIHWIGSRGGILTAPPPSSSTELLWLLAATFGLYGGGVVLNDLFDAKLDALERPERPIPSGKVSRTTAAVMGAFLLLGGVFSAFQVNLTAALLASAIALCVLLYDAKAKHSEIWGPFIMGLCRSGNLLLGVALIPSMLLNLWFLAFIPLLYIAAITLVSQGEVHGGNKKTGYLSVFSIIIVTGALALLSFLPGYSLQPVLPFLLLFALMVFPPFISATRNGSPDRVKKAVKRGVLSLIILNSTLAAGFAGLGTGLLVLILLPLSLLIAKLFPVT